MSLATTVGIAKPGTKSLKVTVPEGMVVYLQLQIGDKLEWTMEYENGERIAKVRKGTSLAEEARKVGAKYSKRK